MTILELIKENYSTLLAAMGQTLEITFFSLIFASMIGLLFGMMNVSKKKVLNGIAGVYIDIIRGIPVIVLSFFIYFGIPMALDIKMSATVAGIITLSLNAGAYMAEIIRGGILSIDKGQMEAARSVGLPYGTAMRKIVLPQAVKVMIPSIINQFIITLKDTSILSVIGLPELTKAGRTVIARNFESFKMWLIVAVMYLIVITILSKVSKALERRLAYDR